MKKSITGKFYAVALSGALLFTGCGQEEPSPASTAERSVDKFISCSGIDRKEVQLVHEALAAFNKKIDGSYEITRTKDGYHAVIPNYPSSKLLVNPETLDDDPINEKRIAIIKDATGCDMADTSGAYKAFRTAKEAYSQLYYLHNLFKDEKPRHRQIKVASSENPVRFVSLSVPDPDLSDDVCAMAVKNDGISDDTVLILPPVIITPNDNPGLYEFSVRLCDRKPHKEQQSDNFQEAPGSEEEGQFEPWPKVRKSGCDAHECRI